MDRIKREQITSELKQRLHQRVEEMLKAFDFLKDKAKEKYLRDHKQEAYFYSYKQGVRDVLEALDKL